MTVACPTCGVSNWRVPMAVEVELTVHDGAVVWVLADRTPVGEGAPSCAGCGHELLDWGSDQDDDAVWSAHHDERRPAWDQLHAEIAGMVLPDLDRWALVDVPEPD